MIRTLGVLAVCLGLMGCRGAPGGSDGGPGTVALGSVWVTDGGIDCAVASNWTRTPLADAGISGDLLALATHGSSIHLLYIPRTTPGSPPTEYAYRAAGGTWTVEPGPAAGQGASLAVDGSGQPNFAFVAGASISTSGYQGTYTYASRTGVGVWSTQALRTFYNQWNINVSLAFDGIGTPHIALDPAGYASPAADGGWSIQTIAGAGGGLGLQLANGVTPVVCTNRYQSTGGAGCLIKTDGGWSGAAVFGAGTSSPSFALDSTGQLDIALSMGGNTYDAGISFGEWTPAAGGGFVASGLAAALNTQPGLFFDGQQVAVDANGNPHLGYVEASPSGTGVAILDRTAYADGGSVTAVVACDSTDAYYLVPWAMAPGSGNGPTYVYSDAWSNLFLVQPIP